MNGNKNTLNVVLTLTKKVEKINIFERKKRCFSLNIEYHFRLWTWFIIHWLIDNLWSLKVKRTNRVLLNEQMASKECLDTWFQVIYIYFKFYFSLSGFTNCRFDQSLGNVCKTHFLKVIT